MYNQYVFYLGQANLVSFNFIILEDIIYMSWIYKKIYKCVAVRVEMNFQIAERSTDYED